MTVVLMISRMDDDCVSDRDGDDGCDAAGPPCTAMYYHGHDTNAYHSLLAC